jgi:hypothetical protein
LKKSLLQTGSLLVTALLIGGNAFAQDPEPKKEIDLGEIHGNVQIGVQHYNEDTLIGANVPPAEAAMNAFTNILYTRGNFSAGIRYESYLNAQLGYPARFAGTGLGYRFAKYKMDELEITVGNFYEQFGNGLIFRTYEERQLGLDNAMDGARVKYSPVKGLYLTGVYGKQRLDFQDGLVNGDGIVRGFDGELNVNEFFPKLEEAKARLTLGGSFVSKFQLDDNANFNLPQNVGAYAGRMNLSVGKVSMFTEFAYKINDPSADNGFIFKDGQAFLANITYSTRGFSAAFDIKTIDNFSFRSDRNLATTDAMINYLPALTKQHTYNLATTLYPYAAQPNGEFAYQGEISYKFKKAKKAKTAIGKFIGGKYGTQITVNYATAWSMDSTSIDDLELNNTESERLGYSNNLFSPGDDIFFSDFNVALSKKFSKKFALTYMYLNFVYNNDINKGAYNNQGASWHGNIYADIHILEMSFKLSAKNNIRTEFQSLTTNQHLQDWATVLVEYTYSPHWFVAVLDQYNYGNNIEEEQIHYLYGTVGYIKNANRFTIGYGKQRAGVFCVGGVCRAVPASNGITFTITSSF